MDFDDEVPIGIGHVFEADISQYARIVQQNVYSPKLFNGRLNDAVAVFHAIIVGDSLPACSTNLVNDNIGCLRDG